MDAGTDVNSPGVSTQIHGLPMPGHDGEAANFADQFFGPAMTFRSLSDLPQGGRNVNGFTKISTEIFTEFLHRQKVPAKPWRSKHNLKEAERARAKLKKILKSFG